MKEPMENVQVYMDEDDLIDSIPLIYDLVDDYVETHILNMYEPKFYETMTDDICDLLLAEWENTMICDDDQIDHLKDHIKQIAQHYFQLPIDHIPPNRSIHCSDDDLPPCYNDKYKTIIKELQSIHQPEQRTEEWYAFRHNLISASSLGKIFGTEASLNRLIYDKCQPLNSYRFNGSSSVASPMHWGQKYEPVSVALYEQMHNTQIGEFGCIQHKQYPFIGASPDGIVIKPECQRYGRMLEIKNIVNRPITGIPLKDYWIQMQMQMECCDLDECDFLETRFKEYEEEQEFWDDNNHKHKGVMLYFVERISICETNQSDDIVEGQRPRSNTYPRLDENDPTTQGYSLAQQYSGVPHYEYMPLNMELTKENVDHWIEQTRNRLRRSWSLYTTIYWYLEEMSCVLVKRNKKWFDAALPLIRDTWTTIEKERETGCEHRAPAKKIPKTETTEVTVNKEGEKIIHHFPLQKGVCLIKL